MEDSIPNKQRTFQAKSDILQNMQLARNISKDDEQHFLRITVLANYIDNFVIPAKTKKELEERTIYFLNVVEKHNLCFKQSKCDFDAKEIPILEVVFRRDKFLMENNKIKIVKEQKTPMKIKEVESFLGFANFYQYFIKNFNHTEKPLNEIKEKKEWKQEEEHQKAFEELKDKITSQLILTFLKRKGKFRVEVDASGTEEEVKTYCLFIKNNATSRKRL